MQRTRRDMLALASAGGIVGVLPAANAAPPLFAVPASAAAIGRAWLANGATIGAALEESVRRTLGSGGAAPRRARFEARVRRDFADGDIVEVEGWLLSRFEADVCALVHLGRDLTCPV